MNRVRSSVIALFLIVIVSLATAVNALAIEWSGYQKDESRNGFSIESISLPLKLANEINIGEELSGAILINGNDFFFTTKKGTVGAGNAFSGTIKWKRALNDSINSCAVLSLEDIFIVTMTGDLYCISQKIGTILWKTKLGKPVSTPLLIASQSIYTATDEGDIVCINRRNGALLWSTDLDETITSGITYKNFNIYTITSTGQVVCINGQSGMIQWNSFLKIPSHCPPVASTESIYCGDDNGNLYCFDHYSDKLYWVNKQSAGFNASMAFAFYDKRVLVASLKDKYIGVITGNGNEMWYYPSDDTSVPPISAGRHVFLLGPNQRLVALDSFDGKELFSYPLNTKISTGLSIGNGKIFFGTETGKIMIFTSGASDFQIELTPSIRTISPGEKTQFVVDIKTSDYFSGSINFSVSGFPCSCKGVNRFFDEQVVTSSDKVSLMIETTVDASEGRYSFTVSGRSENSSIRVAYGILEVTNKKLNTTLQMKNQKDQIKTGEDFVVDILLSDAKNIRSISFMLNYPADSLQIQSVSMGDFYKTDQTNLLFDKVIDNDNGRLVVGFSQNNTSESGSGTIASILFKALKSGNHPLNFSQVSARDPFQYELLVLYKELELTILPGLQKKIVMTINQKTILINGQAYPLESPPVIENGRTLSPLRIIAENLESTVLWEAKEQKITLIHFNKRIELWINRATCLVNGIEKAMPSNVPPRILFSRTYVPLRFIADELDASVVWDGKAQTITILYPK